MEILRPLLIWLTNFLSLKNTTVNFDRRCNWPMSTNNWKDWKIINGVMKSKDSKKCRNVKREEEKLVLSLTASILMMIKYSFDQK